MERSDYEKLGVMPVMVIDSVEQAVPLAEALKKGGVKALEITLRTDAAWDAVKVIKEEVEGMKIGIGTVVNQEQLKKAAELKVDFAISPGISSALIKGAQDLGVTFLPGVATSSDIILGIEHGLKNFKFFPAEAAGGIPMLKSFGGPFTDISFCPTGGISIDTFTKYLALPNVMCVGGSWLAKADLMAAGDWDGITAIAKDTFDRLD